MHVYRLEPEVCWQKVLKQKKKTNKKKYNFTDFLQHHENSIKIPKRFLTFATKTQEIKRKIFFQYEYVACTLPTHPNIPGLVLLATKPTTTCNIQHYLSNKSKTRA